MSGCAFASEAELCAEFIQIATDRCDQYGRPRCDDEHWLAYPETAGFDILMVREEDGAQIGIEAKLRLNGKVLSQILPRHYEQIHASPAPDFRAVLVPEGRVGDLGSVCGALGITLLVVRAKPERGVWYERIAPSLPTCKERWTGANKGWHEWCPLERCPVPEYVPDVAAGASAPVALTTWKVGAIRLAILLEERPITRADFKALGVSPSRWTDPYSGWLVRGAGGYVAGPRLPNFKAQHPRNYDEIKADRPRWGSALSTLIPPRQLALPDPASLPTTDTEKAG